MSELGQKIIENVRAKAAEQPDFIYPKSYSGGCQYVRNGEPSCLVGHALWNVGLINADCEFDKRDVSSINIIVDQEGWELDDDEIKWLSDAQNSQDLAMSWGDSVEYADAVQA